MRRYSGFFTCVICLLLLQVFFPSCSNDDISPDFVGSVWELNVEDVTFFLEFPTSKDAHLYCVDPDGQVKRDWGNDNYKIKGKNIEFLNGSISSYQFLGASSTQTMRINSATVNGSMLIVNASGEVWSYSITGTPVIRPLSATLKFNRKE